MLLSQRAWKNNSITYVAVYLIFDGIVVPLRMALANIKKYQGLLYIKLGVTSNAYSQLTWHGEA